MAELILEPYAVTQHWRLPAGAVGGDWVLLLCEYLQSLAQKCASSSKTCVIGHIKALALFPNNAYIQISVVSPTHPASLQGSVPAGYSELSLSLNVIVYGLEYEQIESLTNETALQLAQSWKGEVTTEKTGQRPISGQHEHHNHSEKENNHE
ncbi:MAG: hypothetical protein P4L50_05205 [Anaerolineaceae bacterium]|nr:hypothetical protein [Anaerolineaceae bacterium]